MFGHLNDAMCRAFMKRHQARGGSLNGLLFQTLDEDGPVIKSVEALSGKKRGLRQWRPYEFEAFMRSLGSEDPAAELFEASAELKAEAEAARVANQQIKDAPQIGAMTSIAEMADGEVPSDEGLPWSFRASTIEDYARPGRLDILLAEQSARLDERKGSPTLPRLEAIYRETKRRLMRGEGAAQETEAPAP